MGEEPGGVKQVGSPKFLSQAGMIGLVAAFCVVVPVAGAAAEEVGGWPGVALWLVAWGVMAAVAAAVTYKYANPFLPILCGVMIGATAPRPSDAWVRQLVGEGWGRALNLVISVAAIGIGMAIFGVIARRHQAISGG